ncbi:MAG: histidine kinase [Bacteroidota bacterium]
MKNSKTVPVSVLKNELKILMLQDNNSDAQLIETHLKQSGTTFNAKIVSDKKQFKEAIHEDSFDVILSGHKPPEFSSVEALKISREKNLDVPFIVVTGTVSEEFAVSIIKQGADDYFLKNNLSSLHASITQAIEKRKVRVAKEKAEAELKASNDRLRELFFHLQNVREEERTRIAREIHDELGQQLTGLKMGISWLNRKINSKEKIICEKINEMLKQIDSTIHAVRRISTELRPGILDKLGLIAALEWQTSEFAKHAEIKCSFYSECNEEDFNNNIATAIFRIYQESLTNVTRHASATQVKSLLQKKGGNIILRISDNGKGFDPGRLPDVTSLGILGMKERAILMGGELDIKSIQGKGTTVLLKIPVQSKIKK